MDMIDTAVTWMISNVLFMGVMLPALLVGLTYLITRKAKEFDRHALQNTAATVVVMGLNIGVLWAFVDDFNDGMQWAYDSLGIPTLDPGVWAGTPFWLTVLVGVVARDFADYWNHRLMHTVWGWPIHAAHHSDTHVNAFTTYRVHVLETVFMTASYVLLLTWLQIPQTIPVVVLLSYLHNHYVHMDLPWDHGPFKFLLASPVFHRWHHADVPEAYGKNLANMIPAWDAMFGTYYANGRCEAEMGAKLTGVEDKDPIQIYIYPFLEWARLIKKSAAKTQASQDQAPEVQAHP